MTRRRFRPPWTVEEIPGGFKVRDANGQSLAYCYGWETQADDDIAMVLTMDSRRIASSPTSRMYAKYQEQTKGLGSSARVS